MQTSNNTANQNTQRQYPGQAHNNNNRAPNLIQSHHTNNFASNPLTLGINSLELPGSYANASSRLSDIRSGMIHPNSAATPTINSEFDRNNRNRNLL